ncbi:hypothetical protein [Deinococcus aquaedulcis]|uniref:hypothetical protein n=1 Tax=Deinococcus aquaedulcis TaxID=2840455 RepID=UPI001C82C770|nr:hypothetical protein [Deinococcus aquaedulcis]
MNKEDEAPPGGPLLAAPPPYTPPELQLLGPWQALTLVISVPVLPGGLNPDPALGGSHEW